MDPRRGERETARHATGVAGDPPPRSVGRKAAGFERFVHAALAVRPRRYPLDGREQIDDLPARECRELPCLLGDVPGRRPGLATPRGAAEDQSASGGRCEEAEHDLERRTLSAAIRAEEGQGLAAGDGERESVERSDRLRPAAEGARQLVHFDRGSAVIDGHPAIVRFEASRPLHPPQDFRDLGSAPRDSVS